jgi:hypothetical protein
MADKGSIRHFGKLNEPEPAPKRAAAPPRPPAAPRSARSAAIAAVVLGTGAIGMVAATSSPNCKTNDPNKQQTNCHSSGGWHGYHYYGGSSSRTQGLVSRGGFGGTGSAHGGASS